MSDSDNWWSQPEPQEEGYYQSNGDGDGYFVPTPVADPVTAPLVAPLAAPAPIAPSPLTAASAPANPYYIDTIMTGGGGGSDPTYETVLVTPDGNISVTQDQSGQYVANVPGMANSDVTGAGSADTTGAVIDIPALADLNKSSLEKSFGTGFGPAVGYDYYLKNSEGNNYQKYDAQGNLTEYLDTNGNWQKVSNVTPTGTVFNPKTGGFDTLYSVNGSQGVTGEWVPGMSVFHEDQGGFLGEGGWSRMAGLAAAALSAGVAGGAFAGLGIGTAPGALTAAQAASLMGVPAGISAGAVTTAAIQGALLGAATSGLQGASPADMLKSSLIGGIAAGGGSLISGAGLGTVGNIAARTGLQTGLTAVSGGDVGQAAISGIINGVLPVALAEALPADTMSTFNSLPDPVKKLVMSTAGSVLNAGFNGTDISDAATSGVVNGMISLGKDFAKGAFNSLTESELAQTVKGYFNPSTNAGGFLGSNEDMAPYDPNLALDEVINNLPVTPPLVQDTINRNTPFTAETVLTPPLSQTAMNQSNPDDVYDQVVAAFNNPQVGAPLGTLASGSLSDINPVAVNNNAEIVTTLPTTTVTADQDEEEATEGRFSVDNQALSLFNEIMQEEGRPDLIAESLSDPRLQDFVDRANRRIESSSGLPAGLYTIGQAGQVSPPEGLLSASGEPLRMDASIKDVFNSILAKSTDSESPAYINANKMPIAEALYSSGLRGGATPEQAQELVNRFLQDPNNIEALRSDITRFVNVDLSSPQAVIEMPPPLVQDAINRNAEQEQVDPTKVKPTEAPRDNAPKGGSGTQGGSLAGDQGRVGAAAPLATASPSESAYGSTEEFQALNVDQTSAVAVEAQSISTEMANLGMIDEADIPVVTANLNQSSRLLNVTPTVAVTNGLVTNEGTLSDAGVSKIASETGRSEREIKDSVQGSSTIEVGTGSGLRSEGTGAATGTGTGVSGSGGLGGSSGTGVGGQGSGVGTGVGSGSGSGSGTGGGGAGSYGGARLTVNPQFLGALPGNLEGTYLKGVDVDAYDPFANYNTYQQIAPVNAAQGGSPLQLMQLQQGIVGGDPRQYSVIQNRPTPNYFTYGADTSSNTPTTFAGSQLMGKPKPSIPVTPTGNIGANDWMYGAAGSNQLSPAGAGIPNLPSGLMAEGGMAHGGLDEGEHNPEFITGLTGHYVRGRGDGQSDDIPAMLADGEYVFDSSSVSTLGNGSSDAGAKLLDAFRETLREHTRSAPADKIPPKASPLQYMQEAMKKVGMA